MPSGHSSLPSGDWWAPQWASVTTKPMVPCWICGTVSTADTLDATKAPAAANPARQLFFKIRFMMASQCLVLFAAAEEFIADEEGVIAVPLSGEFAVVVAVDVARL